MSDIIASFGVITDLHYADHDDGTDFTGTYKRYFRNSLVHLKNAVAHWNTIPNFKFAIQVGDIIDGRNNRKEKESSMAIEKVLSICNCLNSKNDSPTCFLHVIGNHDLYNFKRNEFNKSILNSSLKAKNLNGFKVGDEKRNYYSFLACRGYRIVVLDNYDISVLGVDDVLDKSYIKALHYLKINLNVDYNSHTGLHYLDERFTAYNGAIGEIQLKWLSGILKEADNMEENVVIFGHSPIFLQSTTPKCLSWNYDSILNTLHSSKAVMAYICGHDHRGGYAEDSYGIVHMTLEGTVEKPLSEGDSFLTVDLTNDGATINYGSRKININKKF